jgi:predicted nucleic acid-binding Zn ribbon protein
MKATPPPGESGPENLGDILGRLFTARGWGRKSAREKLEQAWAEVAGPEVAPFTRVLVVRRGVLEVEVKTGVLMQELAQFHKRRLVKGLNQVLPEITIKDVRFRAGIW